MKVKVKLAKLRWIFLCGLLLAASKPAIAADQLKLCESWFSGGVQPKAVVIVTHGMNLKPTAMDDWAQALKNDGYEVFRAAFTGHCEGENDAYLRLRSDQLVADAARIHRIGAARAAELNVPLYLVAYSFSTLVFQTQHPAITFDKKIYLAPAFATKFWYPFVRAVASLFPSLTFQTRNLPQYAANPISGMSGISALDDFFRRWEHGAGRDDETPILGFVEPDDELVSYRGVGEQWKDRSHWHLRTLRNSGSTLPKTYHHLMITVESLGRAEWDRVYGEAKEFLSRPDVARPKAKGSP